MKVISLLQPWATLIVIGAKKIETRSWARDYRGPLLIHASLDNSNKYKELMKTEPFFSVLKAAGFKFTGFSGSRKQTDTLPRGAIIGSVNLVKTFSTDRSLFANALKTGGKIWELNEQEIAFGDYTEGRFGWLLSDPVQFAQPIPAKGQLGLWDFDMPDHFHTPNKYGGHVTFPTPPSKDTLDAVNAMTELAFKNLKK
jgi:hypothetical protein